MKKLINFSFLGLLFAVFFLASTGLAQAESRNLIPYMPNPSDRSGGSTDDSTTFSNTNVNITTKADLEAAIKVHEARCESLREANKEICKKELELFKVKAEAAMKARVSTDDKSKSPNWEREGDREKMKEEFKRLVGNFSQRFEKVIENLQAVLERITKLADRIESRLGKIAANNIDVSVSKKFVTQARAELKLASTDIEEAKAAFKVEFTTSTNSSVTTSNNTGISNPRSSFTKTITNIQEAKTHLKNAHRALVQAIVSFKPGINKIDEQKVDGSAKVNILDTVQSTPTQ